ncbi:N-acetyltransferase [Acrocarpospora phusangensis]|uniref:N-acetyltransferase n=1 Tax=Acrocarpospora phusangensis TaxID=1070424 RepID=A0A919QEV6_9ACTN|nr:GNAT family N-acetyltransferase [Acrocarpospora phusangensis]GIH26499.1 N-acetyltransferase [Acrocarpospora phusangensis]
MIRALRAEDLPAVTAIYAHYVTDSVATFDEVPPSQEAWREKAEDIEIRGLPFLVAEIDGVVAGYAYAAAYRPKPAYRHTVEDTVYLAPGRTGQGIGRALLKELLGLAAEAGAKQMIAVIADNGSESAASLALHAAEGFTEAGRLRHVGFKHGRWLDTVLLQRAL